MSIKEWINRLIVKLPYVGEWRRVFLLHPNAGHFYSPVPELESALPEMTRKRKEKQLHGIQMNEENQRVLSEKISLMSDEFEIFLKTNTDNYQKENIYYANSDALSLYGQLRINEPRRIIEVGSGNSSALMIDIGEEYLKEISLTFIDPNPESFLKTTSSQHHGKIIKDKVQDVPLELFEALQPNDILFVDSSHVCKTGSDVNHIIFNILPILNKGVLIHFHDVFYPFEYPTEWLELGYYWNEAYLLQSFLMYNNGFEIEFMNSWVYEDQGNELFNPTKGRIYSGSIWIRKIT